MKQCSFNVNDKVHFMLEDKYEISGTVTYIGLYYKQVDPSTDKPTTKFGYSDKLLNRMKDNGTIKEISYVGNYAYLDGEIYKMIDNAIEVEFDSVIYYNGVEMNNWTFKENYILKNKI